MTNQYPAAAKQYAFELQILVNILTEELVAADNRFEKEVGGFGSSERTSVSGEEFSKAWERREVASREAKDKHTRLLLELFRDHFDAGVYRRRAHHIVKYGS